MIARRPRYGIGSVVRASACALIIGAALAQEKAPAAPAPAPGAPAAPALPAPEEAETQSLAVKELDAYAAQALKSGFPVRAKQAWLEVIGDYAPDDETARKALGWIRQGPIWKRDPAFTFPEKDVLDPAAARALEQKWQSIAARLGAAHRALAEKLAAAGKKDRADHHLQRALRFVPTDGKAIEQSGRRQFEGISGDEVDITVLQRSRAMDRLLTKLLDQDFAASVVDEKLRSLEAIGAPHHAVKTENFTVYGDLEVEVLQRAAVWAERALAFCKEAYAGLEGFPPPNKPVKKLVFLRAKDTWVQLVKKHKNQRDADFITQNAAASEIDGAETATADKADLVNDFAVRWVVQGYSGLGTDALREGIGHAVVGMFFGRNLVFTVGRKDESGTVAANRQEQKLLLPDLDTWKELALEMAWQRDGVPAARLPLLKAAQFPSDARIKAWSFCDYLLRRDPMLLRRLDATIGKARNEAEVIAAFAPAANETLPQIEERWRRFWTEDTPLRRAVIAKVTPLESASREAPAWLEALNKLRELCGRPQVGWSAELSVACKEHVDYLKANKDQRGPDKEHVEIVGKPGYGNSGRAFAPQALVWTRDPKKAADLWMSLPGYRDAVVNPHLDTVGVYAESGIAVFDVDRGRSAKMMIAQCWPDGSQGGRAKNPVPAAVDVDALGPEVQQLLAANNRGKQKQVGYPLSLHTFAATVPDVKCRVTCQGEEVAGFLVQTKGQIRRTSAPGLWVFYPAEPLKRGVDIKADWTWPNGQHTVTFVAQ